MLHIAFDCNAPCFWNGRLLETLQDNEKTKQIAANPMSPQAADAKGYDECSVVATETKIFSTLADVICVISHRQMRQEEQN